MSSRAAAGELPQEVLLRRVGVLVLVDEDDVVRGALAAAYVLAA